MPAQAVTPQPPVAWRSGILWGAVALGIAGSGWIAFAQGGVALAAVIACSTAWIVAALAVPWIAASVVSVPGLGRRLGAFSGAVVAGAGLAILPGVPAPGASVALLGPFAVLLLSVCAFWGAGVALGRAARWRPVTAQAVVTCVALAQCATPCVAEALVRAAPHGWLRVTALNLVHGANPLLVTGRDIIGWDVWHLPWLYARADVAGYGSPGIGWIGSATTHALAACAVGALAMLLLRRRGAAVAPAPPTPL